MPGDGGRLSLCAFLGLGAGGFISSARSLAAFFSETMTLGETVRCVAPDEEAVGIRCIRWEGLLGTATRLRTREDGERDLERESPR